MDNISLDDVFISVKERILNRIDSLSNLTRLKSNISFEGWLKVETIKALNDLVDKVQNKGSDLKLIDGTKIELKASMDKLCKGYFFHDKDNKYQYPVLFICGGNENRLKNYAKKYEMIIIGQCTITDQLIIGLVKP